MGTLNKDTHSYLQLKFFLHSLELYYHITSQNEGGGCLKEPFYL